MKLLHILTEIRKPHPDMFDMRGLLDQAWPNIKEWLVGAIGAESRYNPEATRIVYGLMKKYSIEEDQDAVEEFLDRSDPTELFTKAKLHQMIQSSINSIEWDEHSNSLIEPKNRRTGWVIHFTPHAEAIQSRGFQYGALDSRIGITRTPRERQQGILPRQPGWVFGYPLRTRRDLQHAVMVGQYGWDRRGYGQHAVVFRTQYTLIHHHGDHEPQALFWGPDVPVGSIHALDQSEEGWSLDQSETRGELLEILRGIIK